MTQLTDPYAPIAAVVPDFIWYGAGGVLFNSLSYSIGGLVYPPVNDVYYSGDHIRYQSYSTPLNTTVYFDAIDNLGISTGFASPENAIPQTIIPSGVSVITYSWDFGNGQTAVGSVASTSYITATPDVAVTLTTVDSLGRSRTVFHNINLQPVTIGGGSIRVGQGRT